MAMDPKDLKSSVDLAKQIAQEAKKAREGWDEGGDALIKQNKTYMAILKTQKEQVKQCKIQKKNLDKTAKLIGNIKKHENFTSIVKIIRSDYYKKIIKLSNKPYIIDKLPMNFRWIGFIIKAFPEAKIIHLERNSMAVCWSNYKTNFVDSGMDFTLSQQNVAEYYALYFDLMKFWFEKFDNKIICKYKK